MRPARRSPHVRAHHVRAMLSAAAGMAALLLLVLPVIGTDVALPLPNVEIPPIKGKTGSFDIIDIDQAAHLMYVGDRVSQGVDIFDISTPSAKYLQTVNTGPANGVSVAKNVNKVFVGTNDSSVVIIDVDPASPTRNTVIAKLSTGGKKRADELDYDFREKKIYIANSDDGIVTVVDAVKNTIIKQFKDMGEGLDQPRYNLGDRMMYMTSSDQDALFQFDPTTDTLIKKYDLGMSCNPKGLAINPRTNQALLGCSNTKTPMVVLWDLKTRAAITSFADAGGCDMTVYSSKKDLWLAACANFPKGAALAIFAGSPVHWVANVATAAGSHALGYDEANNVIYTLDQRPNNAGLMAFRLSQMPK